jgi:hypothetical protein
MERISGANTIDLGGGKLGFRDRNLTAGITGTTVLAAWLNNVQEEIAGIVETAGLTLDGGNFGQLAAALAITFADKLRSMQVFTASGSFTVPAGVTQLRVRVLGAGGGGAGASAGNAGGCGGAGGYAEGIYVVTPGQVITVTIGAAAGGGASGNNAGGNGGTTSFGALCSATGGNGGQNTGSTYAGGAGGVGAGGAINVGGSAGSDGGSIITSVNGMGGASAFGGAGRAVNGGGALGNAAGYGAGGGGSYNAGSGGASRSGLAIVEW